MSCLDDALAIQTANLLGLWPFNETSGTTPYDYSANGYDGAGYSGVTLAAGSGPCGIDAPYLDGANDHINLYSAGLAAAFDGGIGAIAGWIEPDVWAAGVTCYILRFRNFPGANTWYFDLRITSTGSVYCDIKFGATTKSMNKPTYSNTGIIPFVLNWRDAANGDGAELYLDGVLEASIASGMGTWDSTGLGSTGTIVGAANTSPDTPFAGYMSLFGIWGGLNLDASDRAAFEGLTPSLGNPWYLYLQQRAKS